MTSKVIILCGLVALASAGSLRPGDRKQWKAAQASQGSWEIRPSVSWEERPNLWSKSTQKVEEDLNQEQKQEEGEEATTAKPTQAQRFATRTYFGYGDSKPIYEESKEIPEKQMKYTQVIESKPTVQWYHRQPTFSWEYKNNDNMKDLKAEEIEEQTTEARVEEEQKKEEPKRDDMSMEMKKAEAAAEAAALQRAQFESNERALHHHHHHHYHQSRYENNYRQAEQREVIEQRSPYENEVQNAPAEEDTKKSDAEEEIKQVEAEKPVEIQSELKPIVVLEEPIKQQNSPAIKSYTKYNYANFDQVEEKWAPVNYEFRYEVNDEHTGDIKHHEEKAIEGKITGEYALLDADGMTRIVKYTADDENGFLADVTREERTGKKIAADYKPKW